MGAGWKQREVGDDKGLTLLGLSCVGFAVQKAAALTLTTGDHRLFAGAAGAATAVIAPRAVSWQEKKRFVVRDRPLGQPWQRKGQACARGMGFFLTQGSAYQGAEQDPGQLGVHHLCLCQ